MWLWSFEIRAAVMVKGDFNNIMIVTIIIRIKLSYHPLRLIKNRSIR
ncbi:unnamed protein product [Moneuplotes crassus]|uniref:Uncharacterized protein n=1 Tax=Euplotes crassus TaxID=5936 RepID=A0AAD2D3A8_EUPCR|nr:unnamed protein product [Moneuplotes crassus]